VEACFHAAQEGIYFSDITYSWNLLLWWEDRVFFFIYLFLNDQFMDNSTQYIKAGWLYEGGSRPIKKNILLTVKNGVFTAIENFIGKNLPGPGTLINLSCCTVLPPFVDCHVHLSMSASTDSQIRKDQLTASYSEIYPRILEHIHYHFSHGVLAVRDGGDSKGHALRFREQSSRNLKDPVILKLAGKAWYQKGRYGRVIGTHPHSDETLPDAFLHKNELSDHIKVINSGINSLVAFGAESDSQFTQDELNTVVREAHKKGKKVMVHANGKLPVKMALKAGCDSIEHGFFMGRKNLQRMAETETIWIPTLVAMKVLGESGGFRGPNVDRSVVEKTLEHQSKQLESARKFGVTVAVGTDSGSWGVIHGESMVEELKLFMRAGYSLPEALKCATANGAKLLGIGDIIGHLAVGKPATFIVARATPAMLRRKLSYLEGIYLNGIPCSKDFFKKI